MVASGSSFRRIALAGALFSCVLAGCQAGGPGQPTASASATQWAADTSWGTFYVTVAPEPAPIAFNRMFAVAISVHPAADHNRAAADTSVAVDARMPEHNHGMNLQARVTPVGDGRFRAEGLLFHMPGTWELYVDVTRATEMERATFVINVE